MQNNAEEQNKTDHSRRNFIRNSATALAGLYIVPRHVLGKGFIAPSDKLNIAGIGVGGKGWDDISHFYSGGKANIAYLCDVDDRQAAEAVKKFPQAKRYKDFREMFDKEAKSIDAVSVSTPDHTHAVAAMAAMQLGKHVYVQKPMAHDIYEVRKLTEAAKKYKVVTQMGNQGASGDGVRQLQEMVDAGMIGDVHTVHCWTNRPVWPQGIPTPTGKFDIPSEVAWDLWLGTAPARDFNPIYIPANWRGWVDYGTGSLGDMGCHFIDVPYRALKLGYPASVECSVTSVYTGFFQESFYKGSFPPSAVIHLKFPKRGNMVPVDFTWYDGGIKPQRPPELLPDEELGEWDGGILFEGTKGKLMAGLFGRNPTLLPTKLMKTTNLPKSKYPFVERGSEGHQKQWTDACKKGYGAYTSSPFSQAGPLAETVLMGNLAVLSYNYFEMQGNEKKFNGRKQLLWDGEKMKITNFEPANQFVKREYRSGYRLEL